MEKRIHNCIDVIVILKCSSRVHHRVFSFLKERVGGGLFSFRRIISDLFCQLHRHNILVTNDISQPIANISFWCHDFENVTYLRNSRRQIGHPSLSDLMKFSWDLVALRFLAQDSPQWLIHYKPICLLYPEPSMTWQENLMNAFFNNTHIPPGCSLTYAQFSCWRKMQ